MFNCLALEKKTSDFNHISSTFAELKVVIFNESHNPTGKGCEQDHVASQLAETSLLTNVFSSKSKSFLECYNVIRKLFRHEGELENKLN